MGDFARDTQVVGSAGQFAAELNEDWNIWGPNGGYLSAIALRAVGACATIPRPVAIYGHYLRVARFASVEIAVEPLSQGRRTESFAVRIHQENKLIFAGMVRTARAADGLEYAEGSAPDVPAPAALPTAESLWTAAHGTRRPFWQNFDVRVIIPERFELPRPALPAHWLEWYRFRGEADYRDPFLDAGRSLVLLDTMTWPAVSLRHPKSAFIAPSLDIAAWFHQPAHDEAWLLAEARSAIGHGGTLSADMRVWSERG
ncbi:MAG TPA: thioesterase family protein, partial [Polyangiales bacterium]